MHRNMNSKFCEFREYPNNAVVDNSERSLRNKERATTILKGSRLQVIGSRSAKHLNNSVVGDDIVCSVKTINSSSLERVKPDELGRTLRLEGTLALLTFQEKHLTLWRDIPKGTAYSTLEEFTVQTGYGQEGGWVGQMETPVEGDPTWKRKFAEVKFLRDLWKISDVSGLVTTIKDTEVAAKQAASLRLLREINRTLYSGDSTLNPTQIDGFETTIRNNGSADHVKDLRGAVPTQNDFRELAELITANYGNAQGAGVYCSPGGMTTIDQILENVGTNTAQRFTQGTIAGGGGLDIGWATTGINTSNGKLIPKVDLFIAGEYEARKVPKKPSPTNPETLIEGKTSVRAPDTPSQVVTVQGATVADSLWSDSDARASAKTYEYRISAGNRFGLSQASTASDAGANVVAAGSITATITPAPSSNFPATFYEIYSREKNTTGDFLFTERVVDSGAATTVYVDLNARIPGTTQMFVLDLTSIGEMRTFMLKRLAPLHSKEYARIGEYRWGSVNLYAAPLFYAPLRFTMLTNVKIGVKSKSNLLEV